MWGVGLVKCKPPFLKGCLGWLHGDFQNLLVWECPQLFLSKQGDTEQQQPRVVAQKGRKMSLVVHHELIPWLQPAKPVVWSV